MVWVIVRIGKIPLYTHYRTQLTNLFHPREKGMFTLHHNAEENAHTSEEEDKVSKATWSTGLGDERSVQP